MPGDALAVMDRLYGEIAAVPVDVLVAAADALSDGPLARVCRLMVSVGEDPPRCDGAHVRGVLAWLIERAAAGIDPGLVGELRSSPDGLWRALGDAVEFARTHAGFCDAQVKASIDTA